MRREALNATRVWLHGGNRLKPAMRAFTPTIQAPPVAERVPRRAWSAGPPQLLDALLRDRDAILGRAQAREGPVQLHLIPALAERGGENWPTAQALYVPRGCLC